MAGDVFFTRGGLPYAGEDGQGLGCTWPLATLHASEEALVVRVGPFWPLRRTFTLLREDVTTVRVKAGWLGSGWAQVEHRCEAVPQSLTFGAVRHRALCAALEQLGYTLGPPKPEPVRLAPLLLFGAFVLFALGVVLVPDNEMPRATRLLCLLGVFVGGVAVPGVLVTLLARWADVAEAALRRRLRAGRNATPPAESGVGLARREAVRARAAAALLLLGFLAFSFLVSEMSRDPAQPLGEHVGSWALSMLSCWGVVVVLGAAVVCARRLFGWAKRRFGG